MLKEHATLLIEKAEREHSLTQEEIEVLLALEKQEDIEKVFAAARRAREHYFGNRVFLYGFVYFSTWCRNNCSFCYYRNDNEDTIRYRKSPEEVREIARGLAESGVHLLDLTMGEDPLYHQDHFQTILELTKSIVQDNGLPVMVSPGVVSNDIIDGFIDAGATWYALYQETYNRALFSALRLNQSFSERMDAKLYAAQRGLLTEEGLLTGCGETIADIALALLEMGTIGASQLRVMTFVPQPGTPMAAVRGHDPMMELKIIALLRLLYPDVLIPASLDVEGLDGLKSRLNAGSNVVTSIIPPSTGLAGVAQSTRDVEEGGRTVAEVIPQLQALNLQAATAMEYRQWLEKRKEALQHG